MRILIVEDDEVSSKFLFDFLSEYGECDAVVDGLEAIEAIMISLIDRKMYDLICLDIMLPKVDGVATLKAIKDLEKKKKFAVKKNAKVIIITALYDEKYVEKSFEIGCDGFISKPISLNLLAEELKKLGFKKKDLGMA